MDDFLKKPFKDMTREELQREYSYWLSVYRGNLPIATRQQARRHLSRIEYFLETTAQ